MKKITYAEYLQMVRNPNVADETIVAYSTVVSGSHAFAPELRPNPQFVEFAPGEFETENALAIGNDLARARRRLKFEQRLATHAHLKVLVAEGDSWFQFPLLVQETVDHLNDHYNICCVSAAGDTLQNMVHGGTGARRSEYMQTLKSHVGRVKALLFSAAGNDIIGEDETGSPVLLKLLRDYNGNAADVHSHIDRSLLDERLKYLREGYLKMINTVRAQAEFANLPILIHGYDYVFPHPWGDDDPRRPLHADSNKWLGRPFDERNFPHIPLRREIMKHLINALYDMMFAIANDRTLAHVHVVDCRNAMPNVGDWIDEIHGTSSGFRHVAERFRQTLERIGIV